MNDKKDFRKDLKAIRRKYKDLLKKQNDLRSATDRLADINNQMNQAIAERTVQNDTDRKQVEINRGVIKENNEALKELAAEIAELDQAIDDIAEGL